ncbi:MAG: sulfatase/phosphatase domain-containing protein [Armatimonadota bacterium]
MADKPNVLFILSDQHNYSSDHGDYACEHGIMEKAPSICADAITHIAMLWRWPGHFKARQVAEEIVEAVDFANTLCAVARIEPMETADGEDISHLLVGEAGEVHRIGVTELAWSKSVRKGKYRYVYYPREMFPDEYPDGFGELYDPEDDPWEMRNLYFDPDHADVVRAMKDELTDWLVTSARPAAMLPSRPYVSGQAITRYNNTINSDGKIHPDRVRDLRGGDYT